MRLKSGLTLIVSIGLLPIALGQSVPEKGARNTGEGKAQVSPLQATPNNARGLSLDYCLGVGDTLEIEIAGGDPTLNQNLTVSASGEIRFIPLDPIRAEGLTAAELEAVISSALRKKGLLREPEVLVFVRQYQAKRIRLSGEVVRPGEVVMSHNLTVMDAILMADGLGSLADNYAYLHRRIAKVSATEPTPASVLENPSAPREGVEILIIDLRPLVNGGAPDPDVTLREGDHLIIPRRSAEYFYVLGEVLAPSNYIIPAGQTLMASQAISNAGGPLPTAKLSAGMLIRTGKDGKREEMKVDYNAILKGKRPDLEIHPNDFIFIPGSMIKSIYEGFIDITTNMVMMTSFRVARTYQLPDAPGATGNPPD